MRLKMGEKHSKGSWFNSKLESELGDSSIRDIFKKAGKSSLIEVANMSLGSPYGDPPEEFSIKLEKLIKSHPSHSYMDNAGYRTIREEVAGYLTARNLMPKELIADDIILCAGASGGLNCVLKSLLNQGDEVIILAPYFPDFCAYVENHGGVPVVVKLNDPQFDPDIEILEKYISVRTKAIIINTPNNPTGKVYNREQIKKIQMFLTRAAVEVKHPIFLISDETYRDLVYDGAGDNSFTSPATDYSDSIMVYSFSKSVNIPGERIGYVAINPKISSGRVLSEIVSLAQRKLGFTNASALMQYMIPDLLIMKPDMQAYRERRDIISKVLIENKYRFILPEGAFYFYVKYPYQKDVFIKNAQNKGLFVVPGIAFGEPEYFRIAFSRDLKTVNLAVKILAELQSGLL